MQHNSLPGSQRDRDADSTMSSWPAEHYLESKPVKSELTESPDLSRLSRLPLPSVPPTHQSSSPLATGAIFPLPKAYTSSHRQDVRSIFVNAPASSTRNIGQPSNNLETPVSSLPNSSQHVVTNNNKRLRTTTSKVFASSSDLAAHYGIPTILPPPPTTNQHRPIPVPAPVPKQQNPLFDFNVLKDSYLNMLANKPAAEDSTSSSTERQMVAPPAPGPSTGAPASMDDQQLEQLVAFLASPDFKDNPSFGGQFDMNQYLTSPLPELLHDFETSPEETPYQDFLTTPVIATNDSDFLGDYDPNAPLIADFDGFPAMKDASEPVVPHLDMDQLFTISPHTPMLDTPASMDPLSTFNTPAMPVAADFSPARSTTSLPSTRRRSNATGTRKGITPESLVPIDAPTQPRKYVLPSATSRKEVPAVFARKRGRSVAFEDEEDELDGEKAPGPNATEKEQIEWKRRQNTLAARKSRKRKLEHQQQLEQRVQDLSREREVWKTRALTFRQLLVSHGIPFNEFQD